MKKLNDDQKRAAMYYGGAVLVGIGLGCCFATSAWGLTLAVIGAALIYDAHI